MPSPFYYDVPKIIADNNISAFVETGTKTGKTCLQIARNTKLEHIRSVEVDLHYYRRCVEALAEYPQIRLFLGDSVETMPRLLAGLENENILFWLDAHLAAIDSFPLAKELKAIHALRPNKKDVIIIDDLGLYEEGAFQMYTRRRCLTWDGNLVNELFGRTHSIARNYDLRGFIALFPL